MAKGEYLQYGGQALIEGVMMRTPHFFSIACRAPNGEIILQAEPLAKTWIGRQKWLKLPFLRGSLGILDAVALGAKAMRFAANVQLDPRYAKESSEASTQPIESSPAVPKQSVYSFQIGLTLVFGFALGLLLFNFTPNFIAEQFRRLEIRDWRLINLTAEITKIIFLLGYLWLIGRNSEIKRVFQYHGAEHQAINTLENDQELTIENCLKQTRLHPRCGTSFAIVVALISLMFFTFVPRYPLGQDHPYAINAAIRVLLELCILPLVAGISYELIKLAGKFRNTALVKILFWPGLMSQYLTTAHPDEKQTEVALQALKSVIDLEETLENKQKATDKFTSPAPATFSSN